TGTVGGAPTKSRQLAAERKTLAEQLPLYRRLLGSSTEIVDGVLLHHVLAMSTEQFLDAAWPTYRIRVYYDSGRTFTANKERDPVLVPMVPFGLRLEHDGPLY